MKAILTLIAFLSLSLFTTAQNKKSELPTQKPVFSRSTQLIVVTTEDWDKTNGTAALYERKNEKSDWRATGDKFLVVVGRSGLAWAELPAGEPASAKIKKEGDGNAPAGMFPLTASFGSGSKPEALTMPYTKLDEYTECVDDPKSSFYNRIANRMQVGNLDWKSSGKMLAVGAEYELGVFVGYNTYPVEKNRGSCIFLHVWKDANTATSGCTAMERRDLERIVAWLSPTKNPYLVQMPLNVYDSRRKAWRLPKRK